MPWGGLALSRPRTPIWWSGELMFEVAGGPAGGKLVLVRGNRVRTALSFELRDLPLP